MRSGAAIMERSVVLPPKVRELLLRLASAGFDAYAVGGCVRDSLLGTAPQDWDICTSAKPEEIIACFSGYRTILTGVRYGTVTVLSEGEAFEITTFREECGYSDSRHPDEVRFLSSLRGDLARRDFTVNAMAAGGRGEIVDCFGGAEDLKNGIIRCVGTPEERFTEDALRILRALRFAARLDFSIEEGTAAAIHGQKERLRSVAPERLRKELNGLLCGKNAAALMEEFADVLCVLLPELAPCIGFRQYNPHHAFDVWRHTLCALQASEPQEALRLAVLLHDIGKPAVFSFDKNLVGHFYGHATVSAAMTERLLRRLHYDNATTKLVTTLVGGHDFALQPMDEKRMRRMLARYGEETTRLLLRLRRADRLGKGTDDPAVIETMTREAEALLARVISGEQCLSLRKLKLNGNDLIAMGVPRGKQVGALLQRLLDAVLDGELANEHEKLVDYAQAILLNMEND